MITFWNFVSKILHVDIVYILYGECLLIIGCLLAGIVLNIKKANKK